MKQILSKKRTRSFWSMVKKLPGRNACWLWTGCKDINTGYGEFRMDGRATGAHVVAYRIAKGPVPKGKEVCHSCDVRLCVREKHLWAGTRRQNMRDASRKGRLERPRRIICRNGHPVIGENKYTDSRGYTFCRKCKANKQQRYAERHAIALRSDPC